MTYLSILIGALVLYISGIYTSDGYIKNFCMTGATVVQIFYEISELSKKLKSKSND